jgi:signal transduction histidine kinase
MSFLNLIVKPLNVTCPAKEVVNNMNFSTKAHTLFTSLIILILFSLSVVTDYYVNLFPFYILAIIATSSGAKNTFKMVFYLCLLCILVSGYLSLPQRSSLPVGDFLAPTIAVLCTVVAYLLLLSRNAQQYTDTQRLIDRLSDRLDTQKLQQLSGLAAHNFNNLMSVVMGNAELLKNTPSQSEDSTHFIDAILDAVQKSTNLTQGFLSFAQKQFLQPVDIDLNQLIRKHLNDIDLPINDRHKIHFTETQDLWIAKVDPTHFEECLLHVIQNAILAGSSHIEIVISNIFDNSSVADTLVDSKRYLSIVISDNGIGMSEQNLKRIYQPFFTTRKADAAKGLGLSAVWGFCQQSGGHIIVNSSQEKGTTFKIIMPATVFE